MIHVHEAIFLTHEHFLSSYLTQCSRVQQDAAGASSSFGAWRLSRVGRPQPCSQGWSHWPQPEMKQVLEGSPSPKSWDGDRPSSEWDVNSKMEIRIRPGEGNQGQTQHWDGPAGPWVWGWVETRPRGQDKGQAPKQKSGEPPLSCCGALHLGQPLAYVQAGPKSQQPNPHKPRCTQASESVITDIFMSHILLLQERAAASPYKLLQICDSFRNTTKELCYYVIPTTCHLHGGNMCT